MASHSPLALVAELESAPGSVGLCWLGQAGFLIRYGGTTLLIDAFLSPRDGRLYEASMSPGEFTDVDVVLCTHEHVDHLDAPALPGIATASPDARFVVPAPIVDQVVAAGVDAERVAGAQPGDRLAFGEVLVRPVPACHGVTIEDAYGFGRELSGGLVRFLGFVLDSGGVRVYHAGDTIRYDGMEHDLRAVGVDLALLPINGRDAEREARGLVGNLDHREAAHLAMDVGASAVVPMHHDMFARNPGDPSKLVEIVEQESLPLSVVLPERDRPFVWTPA